MKIYIPASIFGHTDVGDENYVVFLSHYIEIKLKEIFDPSLCAHHDALGLRMHEFNKDQHQINIYDDYLTVEIPSKLNLEISVHLSTDFFHKWWYTANYPTAEKSDPSAKRIFMLPHSLECGSNELDLLSARFKAAENYYLSNFTAKTRLNAASLSFFQCNHLTSYRVDVASRISAYGRRFTNADYFEALHRSSGQHLYTILGGSSAYGVCSPDSLTSSRWLGLSQNFFSDVNTQTLNFSQPGSNISNHIPIFIDEILKLKPEVHISLSGYNEAHKAIEDCEMRNFTSSSLSHDNSPFLQEKLIGKHSIGELDQLENILSKNCDELVGDTALKYLALDNICKSNSIRHIVALQPVSYCNKANMSIYESFSFDFYTRSSMQKIVAEKVMVFISKLHKALLGLGIESYNLSEYYPFNVCRNQAKGLDSIFHDGCHLFASYEPILGLVLRDLISRKSSTSSSVQSAISQLPLSIPSVIQ